MNRSYFLTREDLRRTFDNPRVAAAFEDLQNTVAQTDAVVSANVEATERLNDASFLTLSANTELPNERVLQLGPGLRFALDAGTATIFSDAPQVEGGHALRLVVSGDTELAMPLSGVLATRDNAETLRNKTIVAPILSGLGDFADDTAAASGGVPVGGTYRTGSALKVRVA